MGADEDGNRRTTKAQLKYEQIWKMCNKRNKHISISIPSTPSIVIIVINRPLLCPSFGPSTATWSSSLSFLVVIIVCTNASINWHCHKFRMDARRKKILHIFPKSFPRRRFVVDDSIFSTQEVCAFFSLIYSFEAAKSHLQPAKEWTLNSRHWTLLLRETPMQWHSSLSSRGD